MTSTARLAYIYLATNIATRFLIPAPMSTPEVAGKPHMWLGEPHMWLDSPFRCFINLHCEVCVLGDSPFRCFINLHCEVCVLGDSPFRVAARRAFLFRFWGRSDLLRFTTQQRGVLLETVASSSRWKGECISFLLRGLLQWERLCVLLKFCYWVRFHTNGAIMVWLVVVKASPSSPNCGDPQPPCGVPSHVGFRATCGVPPNTHTSQCRLIKQRKGLSPNTHTSQYILKQRWGGETALTPSRCRSSWRESDHPTSRLCRCPRHLPSHFLGCSGPHHP
jgi:hypothetical protein